MVQLRLGWMMQQWLQRHLLEVLEAVMTALILKQCQEMMRQLGEFQAGEGEQQA